MVSDAAANRAPRSQEVPEKQAVTKTPYVNDQSLFTTNKIIDLFLAPVLFTALGAFVRLYEIGKAERVIWDEAHFGKFGSHYIKGTYYFDVHPPLGKMLCGLSGYIAGYNGTFGFESGAAYPEWVDYTTMRIFNSCFSILTVPIAYFTARAMGFSNPAVWLTTLMIALELSFATLARFILLDSMLLLFTVLSFFCVIKFHTKQQRPFSPGWWFWLTATGLSLGLTTSVKMVGLFIMAVVGVYTVLDLWAGWGNRKMSMFTYTAHWVSRIACLIVIPLLVFMACFKLHFYFLYKTGDGLASMSSLFQANLEGSDIQGGPIDVAYGSKVTLKAQGLAGGLLHSHVQTYPHGSEQQQVTTYGHNDANNEWLLEYSRDHPFYNDNMEVQTVKNGDVVRLIHANTGRNLHSHEIRAPVSKNEWEVSCYGNLTVGDNKDHWVVEIAETLGTEDKDTIHPLTTSFRLRHQVLGCYLASEGGQLPEWGFRQGEITCSRSSSKRNKKIWWNIDSHQNSRLPDAVNRTLPSSKFIRDFVRLNFAQMASNNALVPDQDKIDELASSWWEWPTLHRGLRMCGWGADEARYFLFGTPSTVWLTTIGCLVFIAVTGIYILRWQRGYQDFTPQELNDYYVGAFMPFLGWFFHYMPFIIMSRVTYFHHYMPALYFAIFLFVYLVDSYTRKSSGYLRFGVFVGLSALTVGMFTLFSPLAFGMMQKPEDFDYLEWYSQWRMGNGSRYNYGQT